MGLKSVIPKTFKKTPDALLFLKCGMMGLRKSIWCVFLDDLATHTGRVDNVEKLATRVTSPVDLICKNSTHGIVASAFMIRLIE